MKPILYNETGTTQLGVLTECIECYTTEERNGTFSLTLSYPITDSLHHQLVHGKIIKCKPNDEQDEQLFRICNTERIISGLIHVVALHISFDLSYDYIANVNIQNQSCEYVLNTLFRGSQFSSHYRGYSDIVNAQNYKISNVNITEAIAGTRGSIIDTFGTGAEIKRDNTDIYVYNKRGVNKGVTIEYGVNLLDESLKVDIEDLATSIIGTATQTNQDGTQQIITTGRIDSPNINNYVHPYILYKDYTDRFSPEETITEAKIINLINQDYQQLKLDQPKCSYTIDFVPLSKCSGYEDIEDNIHLCDTVRIIDSRYNIDTEAKVIKYTYDVLTERYETMELGDPRNTLADLMSNATKGEKGDKGDKGDKGEDGSMGDFPDTLPSTPVIQGQCIGFGSIQLEWTFENLVYYTYEVYGSLTQGFTPNEFDLIHKGNTSSFLFQAEPGTTWYFRVCCVNSFGRRTEFSNELKIETFKADDFEDYFTNVAIGNAVVNSLSADYMRAGVIKGEWVDAKNLSVTDGNGKRTLDIDSFGNVNIDATTINATAGNLVDGISRVEQTADKINWLVSSGTSSSNMTLSSDMMEIVSENIDLTGKVTFNSFNTEVNSFIEESQDTTDKVETWSGGTTTIIGDYISTGKISDSSQNFIIDLDAGTITAKQNSFIVTVGDKEATLATVEQVESNRAQIEEVKEIVDNLDPEGSGEKLEELENKVDNLEGQVSNVQGDVARMESRVSYAEQQVTQDSIVNKVVSSEKWVHATGGVNTIPNPTAMLNLNGWYSGSGSYITRYEAQKVSVPTPTINDLPSYVPAPPNTTPTIDTTTTDNNVYIDQSDDIRHPELHLIEPYDGGLAMMLIDCSGKVIFIDGGYSSNASHCINYIQSKQVSKIDYYIITHCHTDHGEGTPTILNNVKCDNLVMKTLEKNKLPSVEFEWETDKVYDNIMSKCNEKNIPVLEPSTNSYIKLSNYSGLYIYNSHNSYFDNYNHQSLMLMYVYKDRKIFLAGDGTNKADVSVLGSIGEVDFLQLGHHGDGSVGGTSQALIDELKPRHAYFASAFLATNIEETLETETLKRVSFHGAYSYSHGPNHNNDFMFYITSGGLHTSAKSTYAKSMWYEKSKDIWYWFKNNGKLAANESLVINGKTYNFDSSGVCTNP